MKKFFAILCSAAIVALISGGCSKSDSPEQLQVSGVEKTLSFNASSLSTKSYFGEKTSSGYPTVWSENSKVSVSVNFLSSKDATVTPKGNGNTASFNVSLTQPTADEFVFYAISPSSVVKSVSAQYTNFTVEIPSTQTPTKNSVDEAAHIMFARSSTLTEWPQTAVDLGFSHIAAYGRFTLKNFREDGLTGGRVIINSVEIESDSTIVGRYYYSPDNGSFAKNSAYNVLTVRTENIESDHNNQDMTFWFAIRPVNLSGSNFKITLNTSDGIFVKNIVFPAGKGNFQAGKVASFSVDMDGITPASTETYTLVTDYSVLKEDAKVIIVAAEADFAVGTTQNTNNRAAVGVVKSMEGGVSVIKNPSSAVQVFVLEQGTITNTIAFNCENGDKSGLYIGTVGTSNYLRSFAGDAAEFSAGNCSYNVTLETENTGTDVVNYAILKANSSGDRNFMRYNTTSALFAMYAESSSVTGKVALYVLNGTGQGDKLVEPVTPDPVIVFEPSTKTVTITCSDPTAKIGYSTDGSEPGLDNSGNPLPGTLLYTAPFQITQTTTVKAFAGADHCLLSNVVSKLCTVSSGNIPSPETITFAELNLVNQTQYSEPFNGGNFTVTFAGGANDGKYYTTGSAIRTYGGGTITVSSKTYNIKEIAFTWDGSNKPTTEVATPTGYNTSTGKWTGDATTVVLERPSGSGHWRLKSLTVSYE